MKNLLNYLPSLLATNSIWVWISIKFFVNSDMKGVSLPYLIIVIQTRHFIAISNFLLASVFKVIQTEDNVPHEVFSRRLRRFCVIRGFLIFRGAYAPSTSLCRPPGFFKKEREKKKLGAFVFTRGLRTLYIVVSPSGLLMQLNPLNSLNSLNPLNLLNLLNLLNSLNPFNLLNLLNLLNLFS